MTEWTKCCRISWVQILSLPSLIFHALPAISHRFCNGVDIVPGAIPSVLLFTSIFVAAQKLIRMIRVPLACEEHIEHPVSSNFTHPVLGWPSFFLHLVRLVFLATEDRLTIITNSLV